MCPDTTSDTSIRCTNLIPTVSGQACLVIIQTQADAENNTEYSVATNLTVLLRGKVLIEIINTMNKFHDILDDGCTCSSKCSRGNS